MPPYRHADMTNYVKYRFCLTTMCFYTEICIENQRYLHTVVWFQLFSLVTVIIYNLNYLIDKFSKLCNLKIFGWCLSTVQTSAKLSSKTKTKKFL